MSEKEKSERGAAAAAGDKDEQKKTIEEKGRDPVKIWTWVILLFCLTIFICHLLGDKFTPYTADGRIAAFIVPIAPQVSGTLINVYANNNEAVKADEELAVIDPTRYELAVQRAQADLQQASQASAADVNSVATAQAKISEAEANLRNAEIKGQRIIKLSKVGAASISRADDSRAKIEASQARLRSARSELEKTKSNLGMAGEDNARIKSALTALEMAEFDLANTTIRAPSSGVITNLAVDVGHYASAGAPIMTFISTKDIWIQANMRENSLGHIKNGNPVELVLDAAPGRIFNGEVLSVGYGVSDNSNDVLGGLTTVQTTQGWLRQPQHFPVLIRFTDDSVVGFRRAGGQVNVIVYTGQRPVLNSLGALWIRLISVLSHLY